uniref:Uncharacterized protein n=1 Tax=Arundo donax TaxID=35708 RepID=A0A0A9DZE0_ARUDO
MLHGTVCNRQCKVLSNVHTRRFYTILTDFLSLILNVSQESQGLEAKMHTYFLVLNVLQPHVASAKGNQLKQLGWLIA